MRIIQAFKAWRKVDRLLDAIEKEKGMSYSWKVGAYKAFKDFVITALAVAGAAVAAYFAVPDNLAPILGFLPDTIEKALIPILSSAFVFAANWLKQREK